LRLLVFFQLRFKILEDLVCHVGVVSVHTRISDLIRGLGLSPWSGQGRGRPLRRGRGRRRVRTRGC
jgi:hypothetical protein